MRVWITGGGSGIGAALALHYAQQGHEVWISGRRAAVLHEVAAQHAQIHIAPLDVSDPAAVRQGIASLPPIDLAFLNAGISIHGGALALKADEVRQVIATNLLGVTECVAALLPGMLARSSGHLVLVASVAGYRGLPEAGAYCASKAGVIAFAESLKIDLMDSPLAVSLVTPGFVDTPMTAKNHFPMPDMISAPQAAQIIAREIAAQRFLITFPWRMAWGMRLIRMLPYPLFFALMRWARRLRQP